MRELGRAARQPARVYLTGGATAVLFGWRQSTIDIDIKIVPDDDVVMRAIPELKEALEVNVELAAPDDFIPVREGWEVEAPLCLRKATSRSCTSIWSRRRCPRSNGVTRRIARMSWK